MASHAFLNADEATAHSQTNANRMRLDFGIMEPLEARQRSSALLNWHIEPENWKSMDQKILAQKLTKILSRTRRFTEMRRCLQEAIGYGRYAVACKYGVDWIEGTKRFFPVNVEPRHGDKLVFRDDDGNHEYKAGQVGIHIGAGRSRNFRLDTDREKQIQATEHGLVYWQNAAERKTIMFTNTQWRIRHLKNVALLDPSMGSRVPLRQQSLVRRRRKRVPLRLRFELALQF